VAFTYHMMASTNTSIPNRQKRNAAYRARHRLHSINRDASLLTKHQLAPLIPNTGTWPWIPNKQCGSWYLPETLTDITPVYFKSTDGHVNTYNFSLKRLNLHLIEVLHEFGGCYLVDSSVRKILPDSFSRTIPIWCCVMNRIVQKYRDEMNESCGRRWNVHLFTPASIVSAEEHVKV
jgi:tRNA A64-2'-O-ribosylphosphate transferase